MPAHLFIFIRCFHSFSQSCSPRALMTPLNCEHNFCWESRGAAVGSKKRNQCWHHWSHVMSANVNKRGVAHRSTWFFFKFRQMKRMFEVSDYYLVSRCGGSSLSCSDDKHDIILACVWWKRHLCRNTHHFYLNGPLMVCIYAELKLPLLTAGCWKENGLKLSCCSHGYWCWATICCNTGWKPHGFCRSWCLIVG